MSGVSLSVDAATSDADKASAQGAESEPNKQPSGGLSLMASLRAIELQLVAFVLVFSATGLVPLLDLVFPALASIYLVALSRFAFPSNGTASGHRVEGQSGSAFFRVYAIVGTIIGLLLPLAYALGGLARGDERGVRSVTPHLFLLSCQILTEIVTSGVSALFSPPVIALVPLLYTVRRIFVLMDWIQDVWVNQSLPVEAQVKVGGWRWFGKWLAVGNLVYSSINLLFFLIPRLLPGAFERYFRERDEGHRKMKPNSVKKKMKKSD